MFKFPSLFLLILFLCLVFAIPTFARTTPADIINSQKENYNNTKAKYSASNQTKLDFFDQAITNLNKKITSELESNVIRQGEILDEYVKRTGYQEDGGRDGINRNTDKPIENARYWVTYSHEAIAYQAGKVYVINLTSQSNINNDIVNTINALRYDISTLKSKVQKSHDLVEGVINNDK